MGHVGNGGEVRERDSGKQCNVRRPCLGDHHEDQCKVEDKPGIPKAVALPLERHEADDELSGEVKTEELLANNEDGRSLCDQVCLVQIRVEGHVNGIDDDDQHREVFKPCVPSDVLPASLFVIFQEAGLERPAKNHRTPRPSIFNHKARDNKVIGTNNDQNHKTSAKQIRYGMPMFAFKLCCQRAF